MNSNEELHRRRQAAVPRGVANALPIYAEKALNAELWDAAGRRYLDFATGIAVLAVGHRHPRVVAAVQAQLSLMMHVAFQVTPYESYVALAERLNALAPGPTPKQTVLFTTGAEAVENAIKLARFHTKRSALIAFTGGFHGRTLATMALTGKVQPYKAGFGPLLPEVYHAPYPMPYHGISADDSLAALAQLFKADVDPSQVAAIIIEPVLGEGGFYIAPPEFLRALRALCDQHGMLLIADEIQTGFGRTGRMFAIEHAGIEPDLITVAKSLGGGLPISGVIGKRDIMNGPAPGGLGGTYSGSPPACAAALAVLDVIAEEKLLERARQIGARMQTRLQSMQTKHKAIGEVRALGAMIAIELPDAELTRKVVLAAAERGLIVLSCGLYSNAIRLLPPLTIPEAQLAEGLDILEASLTAALTA